MKRPDTPRSPPVLYAHLPLTPVCCGKLTQERGVLSGFPRECLFVGTTHGKPRMVRRTQSQEPMINNYIATGSRKKKKKKKRTVPAPHQLHNAAWVLDLHQHARCADGYEQTASHSRWSSSCRPRPELAAVARHCRTIDSGECLFGRPRKRPVPPTGRFLSLWSRVPSGSRPDELTPALSSRTSRGLQSRG